MENKGTSPFYAHLTLMQTHRSWKGDKQRPIDPATVKLPAWYPDTPMTRKDWALGLESAQTSDRDIGDIVARLKKEGLYDNTIIVITADHGEEFLDHGGRLHYSSRAYQEMLHVPLLLRVPGAKKVPLSHAPFSHLHLAPTILHAMGMEAPPEFAGRSYWAEGQISGEWESAISESVGQCTNPMEASKRMHGRVLAVQDRRYKLILDCDRHFEELFDLEGDPRELRAVPVEQNKAERARLLGVALQHLSRRSGGVSREWAIRARLHEIGLEWKHSKMDSKPLAS